MQGVLKIGGYGAVAVLLAASTYLFYSSATEYFATPCEKPIVYMRGDVDPRFGVSDSELMSALARAADVWNEAAGKTVLAAGEPGTPGGVPVDLVYGTEQKTAELGEAIDQVQVEFEKRKQDVEALRDEFVAAKSAYEVRVARFDEAATAYHEQVRYWNAQGGAPEQEFQALEEEQRRLEKEQEALQGLAQSLNELSDRVNTAVNALNTAARAINAKVGVYNERAGEDFDQGHYQHDGEDARITIYQFDSEEDLTRILAHELGHALGIGHVENPESIMYSYNIGEGLVLSEEDRRALKEACRLDN